MENNNVIDSMTEALRRALKHHAEYIAKYLPEIEVLRRQIAESREQNNALHIKHETAVRHGQRLELENKQLKAQLDMAVAAARKTEAFNLENRSSFVMQKVQVETAEKERDILEEKIIKLQLENVTLMTQIRSLENQETIHEKKTYAAVTQLKSGASMAAKMVKSEKENVVAWIRDVKAMLLSLSTIYADREHFVRDFKAQVGVIKENLPEKVSDDQLNDQANDKNYIEAQAMRQNLASMQIRLTQALDTAASSEASLNETVKRMDELVKERNEMQLKIENLEAEIARLNNQPVMHQADTVQDSRLPEKEGVKVPEIVD